MSNPLVDSRVKQEMCVFQAGQTIFREGEPGDSMYLIVSGQVTISKKLGGVEKELAKLEQGDFFGEMAILEQESRLADAVATEETKLLKIDRGHFPDLLRMDAEIPLRMLRRLSYNLRSTENLLDRALHCLSPSQKREILSLSGQAEAAAPAGRPRARLTLEGGGRHWDIRGTQAMIGRRDNVTQLIPDVDLREADVLHSVSRCHARLIQEEDEFFLVEEPAVKNGTQLNGQRLPTGVPHSLQSGDLITIGYVKLRFEELGG